MLSLLVVLFNLAENMKNEQETQHEHATIIVDALVKLREHLAYMVHDSEWSEYAGNVINQAVAIILEHAIADKLQTAMIDLLQGLHARAIDERDAMRRELEAVRG